MDHKETAVKPANLASLMMAIILPLTLILSGVRFLLTDLFIQIEYRTPGFPPDPYGFTLEDRLRWAPIALDYLLNDSGIEFLADLRFDSGEPVYDLRELRHMEDVKGLTRAALCAWYVSLGAAAVLFFGMRQAGAREAAWRGLYRGAWLTLLLMALLAVGLAIAFSFVFVGFHHVFFEGESWLFRYSDTLIRLFPERFWRDAFIFMGGVASLGAGALFFGAKRALG